MRPQTERKFYLHGSAIIHAKVAPDGAREITEAEAYDIRAARPKPTPAPAKAVAVADPDTGGIMLQPLPPPVPDSAGKLALAVALANYAIQAGVQAGDYRWHGGPDDFSWNGMRFDAPDLIEYAKSLL